MALRMSALVLVAPTALGFNHPSSTFTTRLSIPSRMALWSAADATSDTDDAPRRRQDHFLGPTVQNVTDANPPIPPFDAVTRESFLRDMAGNDAVVMRKKKNGHYKIRDNRDHMPFVVRLRNPTEGRSGRDEESTDGAGLVDLNRKLGEFSLDRYTNCGDMLVIGTQNYEVRTASCEYKYAGGKQFVVVRKVLEVTEVGRLAAERMLERQFESGGN